MLICKCAQEMHWLLLSLSSKRKIYIKCNPKNALLKLLTESVNIHAISTHAQSFKSTPQHTQMREFTPKHASRHKSHTRTQSEPGCARGGACESVCCEPRVGKGHDSRALLRYCELVFVYFVNSCFVASMISTPFVFLLLLVSSPHRTGKVASERDFDYG